MPALEETEQGRRNESSRPASATKSFQYQPGLHSETCLKIKTTTIF
jgi:hypothetical protein